MKLLLEDVMTNPQTEALKKELEHWEVVVIDRTDGSIVLKRKTK